MIALLAPLEAARPDDLALAYMLGSPTCRTNRASDGQRLIDRILRNGDSAEARLMMGVAKRAVQDLAGALEDLGKAVALNPELPGVHSLYGQALLETGNRDKARAEFEAALVAQPARFRRQPAPRRHAQGRSGVRPGAGALHPRARRAARAIPPSATRSRRCASRAARPQAALPLLEGIVKDAPQFLEAHVSLATVYYRLQRREDGRPGARRSSTR